MRADIVKRLSLTAVVAVVTVLGGMALPVNATAGPLVSDETVRTLPTLAPVPTPFPTFKTNVVAAYSSQSPPDLGADPVSYHFVVGNNGPFDAFNVKVLKWYSYGLINGGKIYFDVKDTIVIAKIPANGAAFIDVNCIGGEWCQLGLIQILPNNSNYVIEPGRGSATSPKYDP